ncbi:BrnT family toxin [Aerosakkonema sp. BLCC-F183]|uniref:BrnT family toxin n=1 Tax=Aerosakkonema sp. BLCC-F183 TaxID=3342834 RepID=UPI0035BB20AD
MTLNFEWDEEKASANLKKHKISFVEAATVFSDPLTNSQPDAEKDDLEMLDEYDFSQGVRGKYFQRYRKNNLPALADIQFLTDSQGRKTGVIIDLKEHWELWVDILEKCNHSSDFQYLTNERGKKIAVFLDFKNNLEIWQEIYDCLIV